MARIYSWLNSHHSKTLKTKISYKNKNNISSMGSKPIIIRLIRNGSRPYWKSCIASYYRQRSTNIKRKIMKLKPVMLSRAFGPSRLTKKVLLLILEFILSISTESCL